MVRFKLVVLWGSDRCITAIGNKYPYLIESFRYFVHFKKLTFNISRSYLRNRCIRLALV